VSIAVSVLVFVPLASQGSGAVMVSGESPEQGRLSPHETTASALSARGLTAAAVWPAASAPKAGKPRGCVDRIRRSLVRSIVDRRSATWRWQDELEVDRSRTSYRERVAIGCAYLQWIKQRWAVRADGLWRLYASLRDPEAAIRFVFGDRAGEALGVAWCESRFRTWARNGQYLGLFQMGSSERARFGHGDTALEQARAAKRYYDLSGWSPWQCLPYGGLRW